MYPSKNIWDPINTREESQHLEMALITHVLRLNFPWPPEII